MDPGSGNPYIDAQLRELYDACQLRAGELLRPPAERRTPEQRADLARDSGYLLLAVAARINVSPDGGGRFIDVEDERGRSLKVGRWIERPDGRWVLTIARGAEER